ncbi:MAG: hypothetical protein JWO19_1270 [Bryobacterales bacterium]|nr:hypothetical protein [Bryobacterales bacterium]
MSTLPVASSAWGVASASGDYRRHVSLHSSKRRLEIYAPTIIFSGRPTPVTETTQRQHARRHLEPREACFEDYDQIAALQSRNGLATRSREEWTALWKGNPAYEQRRGQWPIGWVLEAESGTLVGFIGNVPISYSFKGQELVAATSISWVVDPNYRRFSMILLDRITRQKDIDFAISTTVSANAEPGYRTFHWSRVPLGAWDKSEFWITNYRGFLQCVFRMKSLPLAGPLSYPAAAALFLWDGVAQVGRKTNASSSAGELCSQLDSRFDDFWTELKNQNHNVLLAVRSRETLEWHFGYSLRRGSSWILGVSTGSRLVAYAIFNRQDNPVPQIKRVRLIDFQALRGFETVLQAVLAWGLQKCREQGVHILENVGCSLVRPELPQIRAPYHRTFTSWAYYYKAKNKELNETLKDPAVWAPSSFDGDLSL